MHAHITYSAYQALLFPLPREARASPYAGKRGTGDKARLRCIRLIYYLKAGIFGDVKI